MWSSLRSLMVLGLLAAAGLPAGVAAADEDTRYTVRPGDTLVGVAKRLLDRPNRWLDVQRYNGIRTARSLRPGSVLRLRPEWLATTAAPAQLESVGGDATVDGRSTTSGASVTEGSVIETGPDGTATVRLADGTLLRIPPASKVRLERLRTLLGDDALDARIRLERGSVEPAAPPKGKRRLEIKTPAGNAAVRGTAFRVRTESGSDFVEVLSGAVDAGSNAGRAAVDGGSGAVVSETRAPLVERLLPAPDLRSLQDRRFAEIAPLVELPTIAAAQRYLVEVAHDPDFVKLLLTERIPEPRIVVPTRGDGPLYLRLRGVSSVGLDGLQSVARVEIQARPIAPRTLAPTAADSLLAGEIRFQWAPTQPGLRYRIQLADDDRFTRLLAETVADGEAVSLPLPPGPPGRRWWRVAAIEVAAGGQQAKQGPYSPAQPFGQRAPAPIERAAGTPVVRDASGEPIRTGSGGVVTPGF